MRCGDDRSQPIYGRSSQKDIVGGVGVDYHILNLDGLAHLPLGEICVKLDITSGAHSLTRETNNEIVIRPHLLLGYPHFLKHFPIKDIHQAPLVYRHLHDGELVYVDLYHHGIVVRRVDTLEVFVGKGNGWHPRSEGYLIDLMHCPQVFLSSIVGATSLSESFSYCVNDLAVTSSSFPPWGVVPSWRVISSWPTLRLAVILLLPRGDVIPSPRRSIPSWGPFCTSTPLHKSAEMSDLDKFLYLIL